jgi:hypothetical protein
VVCTGCGQCDAATGACAGTGSCDDGDNCTVDACVEDEDDLGQFICTNTAVVCTGCGQCDAATGACAGTGTCNDNNLCTTDACIEDPDEEGAFICEYTAVSCPTCESCDPADGDCKPDEFCCDPACAPGQECTENNLCVCTEESCAAAGGVCCGNTCEIGIECCGEEDLCAHNDNCCSGCCRKQDQFFGICKDLGGGACCQELGTACPEGKPCCPFTDGSQTTLMVCVSKKCEAVASAA